MDRKQLYNHITGLGLQDEIKSQCGRNYTQVDNFRLEIIVTAALKGLEKKTKTTKCNKQTSHIVKCDKQLIKLVEILAKKKILLKSEIDQIMNV